MKIALTTYQLKNIGGISQFLLGLGRDLTDRGHDVVVVTFAQGSGQERLAAAGLPGVCLEPRRYESRVQHTRRVARYLERAGFDAIVNSINIQNGVAQRCLRFLPDRMVRLTVLHNVKPGIFELAAVNRNATDAIVAVSPVVQREAVARLLGQPIQCILNGIRLPAADALRRRCDWSAPLCLLFVGRLENTAKDITLLPKILATCVQQGIATMLTVVGDGRDRPLLEGAIAANGLSHVVEVRGAQPPEVVYQEMQSHHVLLLPSIYEGLPLVLLEAQANGCVPIASLLPGATDVAIADGVTGLLAPPGDAAAFAQHVARLADPERWRSFSRAAIARAQAEFSEEAMGERYHRLLSDLATDRGGLAHTRGRPDPLFSLFTWRDFLPPPLLNRLDRLGKRPKR